MRRPGAHHRMATPAVSSSIPNNILILSLSFILLSPATLAAGDNGGASGTATIPKRMQSCDGIYLSYTMTGREKSYPHVKNVSAQSWAFTSQIEIVNMGTEELKSWEVHIQFSHREVIVSVDGGQIMVDSNDRGDGDDYPVEVGKNGAVIIAGYPHTDLETAIGTAADMEKMSARASIKGTMFGVGNGKSGLPKAARLANKGYKCPAPNTSKNNMEMCCRKDKNYKAKKTEVAEKASKRRNGDLNIMYDVLQAYGNNYLAQVTISNDHPLGRLDHWNLTWEWTRGEFITNMRGAYTHLTDPSSCIYGPAGQYYQDMDFSIGSKTITCDKIPTISDLPRAFKDDDKLGKLPFCCRNGTLLPKTMDEAESKSVFQLQVFKLPPDLNRTAIFPPQRWRISGLGVNPTYQCSPPVRVDPSAFPDPTHGLNAKHLAVATWQITCNITHPKARRAKCCVSFSSAYNASAVPCNTCACGCPDDEDADASTRKCSAHAPAMLLPSSALLVPPANRSKKAIAWARINHFPVWNPNPCPDNCGVSLNWHLDADYNGGWTARLTLFNWGDDVTYEDWFAAVRMKGKAATAYQQAFSFNGTVLGPDHAGKTVVFLRGGRGLEYLIAEKDGSGGGSKESEGVRVPGKQQSVIMFKKKLAWGLNVVDGDGFPESVVFNGEECALPMAIPTKSEGDGTRRITSHQLLPRLLLLSVIAAFVCSGL